MFRLTWKFDNDHQWHRDFESFEEAYRASYDFGLFTHPRIIHVHVKDLESDGPTASVNLIDRSELQEV